MDAGITRTVAVLVAIVGSAAALVPAQTAEAAPRVLSARFAPSAVSGTPLDFRLRASDLAAPVTGMVVGFGSGGGFGLSSCAIDSTGRVLSPAGPVSLSAPHTFTSTGRKDLAATVTSGGCAPDPTSTLQRIAADVVGPGATPRPLVLAPPLSLTPALPVPRLPGLGAVPQPPGALPDLPIPAQDAALRCPGAADRVHDTAVSRAKAGGSLLCLNNYERARRGLRPMRANERLSQAALGHSRRMVRLRFFGHVGPGALSLSARLRHSRYLPPHGGSWLVGENIGFGRGRAASPLAIHKAWMHSTPHRMNILRPGFREVGFGIYGGAPFGRRGVTYTADFGRLSR